MLIDNKYRAYIITEILESTIYKLLVNTLTLCGVFMLC